MSAGQVAGSRRGRRRPTQPKSVLYDAPGPSYRRHQLMVSLVGGLIVAGVVALVTWKLASEGIFDSAKWKPFNNQKIWQNTLIPGLKLTLKAAGLSIALSIVAGVIFCAGRLSELRAVRYLFVVIVEVLRATPVLLLILFFFIAWGKTLGTLWPLVIGLTLYNGAVLSETFRAGIAAVPRGQREAAYSVGMSKSQVMRLVLIPQAVRAMLPAIISQCVVVLKDTSLGYIVSYQELIRRGRTIYEQYDNIIPTAIVLAAMYIAVNYLLSRLATFLESQQRRRGRATVDPATIEAPMESRAI
ncbi:MAG: amino acid ABC transporter permease [Mycobacteriales bacterium]